MQSFLQTCTEAVTKANGNLLEISQWKFKLVTAGVWLRLKFQVALLHARDPMVADAFVNQMEAQGVLLRAKKDAVEQAIASGTLGAEVTSELEGANNAYKEASQSVRKQAVPPKPKGQTKPKAKKAAGRP